MQLLGKPALGADRLQMRGTRGIDAPGEAVEQNHVVRGQLGGAGGGGAKDSGGHGKRGAAKTERGAASGKRGAARGKCDAVRQMDRPAAVGTFGDRWFHRIVPVVQPLGRATLAQRVSCRTIWRQRA